MPARSQAFSLGKDNATTAIGQGSTVRREVGSPQPAALELFKCFCSRGHIVRVTSRFCPAPPRPSSPPPLPCVAVSSLCWQQRSEPSDTVSCYMYRVRYDTSTSTSSPWAKGAKRGKWWDTHVILPRHLRRVEERVVAAPRAGVDPPVPHRQKGEEEEEKKQNGRTGYGL